MQHILIAAVDQAGGLGKAGKMPWYYPEDLAFFRSRTYGNVVVMGRRTWESLGQKPLKGRTNLILTHQPFQAQTNAHAIQSLDQVTEFAHPEQNIFYIGGASVYREALKFVDRIYLTQIPGRHDCDVVMPAIPGHYTLVSAELSHTPQRLRFETYVRSSAALSDDRSISTSAQIQR